MNVIYSAPLHDYPRVGALRLKAITGFDPFYCSVVSLEEH